MGRACAQRRRAVPSRESVSVFFFFSFFSSLGVVVGLRSWAIRNPDGEGYDD